MELAGRPLFLRSLGRFVEIEPITCRILVVAPEDIDYVKCNFGGELRRLSVDHVVAGGTQRHDSVAAGLNRVPERCALVAIHDAVRPLVPARAIRESLAVAEQIGAACVGVPAHDTIKRTGTGDIVEETLPRQGLWLVQTPQVFRTEILRAAYIKLHTFPGAATDDAQLVELLGHPVAMVAGACENMKVTTRADLRLAEAWLQSNK